MKHLLYCNSWISVQIQNLQLSVHERLCIIIYVTIICSNHECFSCVMLKSVTKPGPVTEVTEMPTPRFKRSNKIKQKTVRFFEYRLFMYIHQCWEMAWGPPLCIVWNIFVAKSNSHSNRICLNMHTSYSGFLILLSHEMKLKVDFKCDWTAVDHVSDISQCLTSFSRYLNESKTICKSSVRTFKNFVHPALLF